MKTVFISGLLLLLGSFTWDNKSYYLKDIQFEINSDKLTDEQVKELETTIKTIRLSLKEESKKTFTLWINGNSDTFERNGKRLSINRAEVVKKKLLNLELVEGTLITRGYGKKRPLTESNNPDVRKKNARVDFQIELE